MFLSLLATLTCGVQVDEHLSIYPLVPFEAAQGWKLELFELARPILPHYHKLQRQFVLMVEGELKATYGNHESIILQSGQLVQVDPGVLHSLVPEGSVRFFAIDLPGFAFPDDVFYDAPIGVLKWMPPNTEFLPLLDPKFFGAKIERGDYEVHELISGNLTENKWSVALLEIRDSPKHFHRIEKEIFIVVNGKLDIEIDGIHRILEVGESVEVIPEMIHQLKSASKEPVRVLCFNFPAFNPADHWPVHQQVK